MSRGCETSVVFACISACSVPVLGPTPSPMEISRRFAPDWWQEELNTLNLLKFYEIKVFIFTRDFTKCINTTSFHAKSYEGYPLYCDLMVEMRMKASLRQGARRHYSCPLIGQSITTMKTWKPEKALLLLSLLSYSKPISLYLHNTTTPWYLLVWFLKAACPCFIPVITLVMDAVQFS